MTFEIHQPVVNASLGQFFGTSQAMELETKGQLMLSTDYKELHVMLQPRTQQIKCTNHPPISSFQ